MKQITLSSSSRDRSSLLEWVDSVADRFEQAWKNGLSPRITDFLSSALGEERTVLLRELARIDLERRLKRGEHRSWEDYLRAFPELREEASDPLSVVAAQADTKLAPLSPAEHSLQPQRRFLSPRSIELPVIAGFEVLCELGHGGMGTVYKARQQRLKRLVALKMLRSAIEADPKRRTRFRTEAEATARLQHPSIAQLHEIGEQDGVPYLVMEYVEGGSLGDRLRGKPQPLRQTAELIIPLARAMDYAHDGRPKVAGECCRV